MLNDHYEAAGHAEAFDFLYEIIEEATITEEHIKKLHHLFYYRIDEAQAGEYRTAKVFISGTKYIPPAPEDITQRMQAFVKEIPVHQKSDHPVVFTAWVHRELVDIHPFVDGNGRTARLIMNLALLQAGYVATIILPIRRGDYIPTIVKSQVVPQKSLPFNEFIAEMVVESQKDYLRMGR